MTSERKKPTAGFWITVALVAALVAYPLSFGPACWTAEHGFVRHATVWKCYRLIVLAMWDGQDGGNHSHPGIRVLLQSQGDRHIFPGKLPRYGMQLGVEKGDRHLVKDSEPIPVFNAGKMSQSPACERFREMLVRDQRASDS